jgi:hypothetical protein
MFGECVGWPGIVKLYAPSEGRMSSTARNRIFFAPAGVGYSGWYGGGGGRGGISPETAVLLGTANVGPASCLRKHLLPSLSVQPLHEASAAHAQQHSFSEVVSGPAFVLASG